MLSRPESNITDILAVNIGMELLKIVPGRVRPPRLTCFRRLHAQEVACMLRTGITQQDRYFCRSVKRCAGKPGASPAFFGLLLFL